MKEADMTIYDFTFVVDADPIDDTFEDRFIEAGCDDATFVLMRGNALLSFDREADSYKDAVLSAYQQIRNSGSEIVRFEPDFLVSQVEIASRSGLTKQAIGMFIKGERRAGFPAPNARIESASPLWDWVEVSHWLLEQGKVSAQVYGDALISRIINVGSQVNHLKGDNGFDIEGMLKAA